MNTIPNFGARTRLFLYPFLVLCAAHTLFAQSRPPSIDAELFASVVVEGSTPDHMEFRLGSVPTPEVAIPIIRRIYGLAPHDSLGIVDVRTDRLGYVHYRLQQYNGSVAVRGAEFLLHGYPGSGIRRANGLLVGGLPRIDDEIRRDRGRLSLIVESGLNEYLRRYPNVEIGRWDTIAVMGERIVCDRADETDRPSDYHHCVEVFALFDSVKGVAATLFIDTKTGRLIKEVPASTHNCVAASGATQYNGTRSFGTEGSPGDYNLYNDCVAGFDGTVYTQQYGSPWDTEVENGSTTWTNDVDAVGGHWAGEQAMTYYWDDHGRRSYNGASSGEGTTLDITVNYPFEDNNGNRQMNAAWFSGPFVTDYIKLGWEGTGWGDVVSLDVVGHEYTHAVIDHEADFDHEGESGALDEGFGDIFGEMIERFALGTNDWNLGDDVINGGMRRLSNPNALNDPDTYGANDAFWVNPNCSPDAGNDYCGVHNNATVLGFWFFLLTEGGTGTNANSFAYNVTGIGANDAASIAYLALTEYLGSSSDYQDARYATIWAAEELFGSCSFQLRQVAAAWDAVGVMRSANNTLAVCNLTYTWSAIAGVAGVVTYSPASCGTSDAVTVASGGSLTTWSGEQIIFEPGFQAVSGSTMHAFIDCVFGLDKPAIPPAPPQGMPGSETSRSRLDLSVAPNPSRGSDVDIVIAAEEGKEVTVTLVDEAGRRLDHTVFPSTDGGGPAHYRYTPAVDQSGAYLVIATNGSETKVASLIIYVD